MTTGKPKRRLHRTPNGYWYEEDGRKFIIDRNWGDSGMWELAELENDQAVFITAGGYTHLRDIRKELDAFLDGA